MRLIITSKNSDVEYFIKSYLLSTIKDLFIIEVKPSKLIKYDKLLNINSYNVLLYYIKHLSVSKAGEDKYIIQYKDKANIRGKPISYYVKYITYGSLTISGYRVLINVFKYVKENINDIYEDYLSEC